MASKAPNASDRVGRRLSELLDQPQDPFLLDLYLVENGCSGKLVGPQGSPFCWPFNVGKRLQKLGNHGCITRVLFKLSYSKAIIKKTLHWCRNTATDKRSGILVFFSEEGSTSKLSAVSVVEPQHSDECQPATCRIPAKETLEKFSNRRTLLLDCLREAEERIWSCHGFLDSDMFEEATGNLILAWERQRVGLNNLSQIVDSDSSLNDEWKHFKPEFREIGLLLEAAIFADLKDEAFL